MSTQKTDFLKFNAYSLKDLIVRKMSEDSRFTDQIYEGSNLNILIDLVAYMYQCLMYQLNNAASESMFSDTQIYENINRLVNLIGYHPKGCNPSEITLFISDNSEDGSISNKMIPPFSYIDSGLFDSRGNAIYFSTGFSTNSNDGSEAINQERFHTLKMYNGKWELYPTVFTSSGEGNETFVLSYAESDSQNNKYVSNKHIKAIVVKPDGEVEKDWYADYNELIMGISQKDGQENYINIYNNKEPVYSIRLNENKQYEIKFGNGIVGKKLEEGSKIYVFYLNTNGTDGNIDIGDFNTDNRIINKARQFGFSTDLYKKLINNIDPSKDITSEINSDSYTYTLDTSIINATLEESVQKIRENAPNWFKTGNRLITSFDYEWWIKNNQSGVVDVKCMNNWEYLASFYSWLYKYGLQYKNDGSYFITSENITRNNCKYIDAADANNTYLWLKMENDSTNIDNEIKTMCKSLKTMTTEVEVLSPVNVYFDICATTEEDAQKYIQRSSTFGIGDDGSYESYIEITLDDGLIYVNPLLKQQIANIFKGYFNKVNCKIGQNIDFGKILTQIYEINGIKNVRTVYKNGSEDINNARIINGISMASWSDRFIMLNDRVLDMNVSNVSRKLEDFQFPILNNPDNLQDKIKIIRKQLSNIGTIKF